MDDSLAQPSSSSLPNQRPNNAAQDAQNSDSEEEQEESGAFLDWSQLSSRAKPSSIPKRGEKDFEPTTVGSARGGDASSDAAESAANKGSSLQQHILAQSRQAMFSALRSSVRSTSGRALSWGVWYPDIARVHVKLARGSHISSMGHSALRPGGGGKRLELLPEEAVYMMERGSLFCYKALSKGMPIDEECEVDGEPMSVQQAYSEMLGREDVTMEKLQVYAYLRRLGYVVTRSTPPTPEYPRAAQHTSCLPYTSAPASIMSRIRTMFSSIWNVILRTLRWRNDWKSPVRLNQWLRGNNYPAIYQAMRKLIPSGHRIPLLDLSDSQTTSTAPKAAISRTKKPPSPYHFFYNVYKPCTPFKRTAPGSPDYQLVVIDARTTRIPTLHELTALFGELPELSTPLPRRRTVQQDPHANVKPQQQQQEQQQQKEQQRPRPNPFLALKSGRKMAVIAVVDGGSIGFYRFCEGVFKDWCMM